VQSGASAPALTFFPETGACARTWKVVSLSLENRLCLGVLIGRQRFRTLANFVFLHGIIPVHPACAGYGAGHHALWRRTRMVTQERQQTLRLGELQRVAGIHSETEIVHKSVIALTGGAVPASAFTRLRANLSTATRQSPKSTRTRTL